MGDYCCTVVENAIRSFEIEFEESLNQRNEEVKMVSLLCYQKHALYILN